FSTKTTGQTPPIATISILRSITARLVAAVRTLTGRWSTVRTILAFLTILITLFLEIYTRRTNH
ncbi:MAG: hypothetical protein VX869_08205, partial [Chloroflexota bacterium]|nr:hypothetical protein [Chloroflexota bacterium]